MKNRKLGKLVTGENMKPEDSAAFVPIVRGLSGKDAIDAMISDATVKETDRGK